jgi:hypothetical protein
MKRLFFAIAVLLGVLTACEQTDTNEQLITKKIQYDVNIKSPDPEWDWWIQNLVGPDREKLVDLIMDGALEGKFQAYDYFGDPISPAAIRSMLADTAYLTYKSDKPPYAEYDTAVIYRIERSDILRIRFLEEWYIDPTTMQFEKKVLGIGPVAHRYDFAGNERWQPLFWIYTDKDFIESLKKAEE